MKHILILIFLMGFKFAFSQTKEPDSINQQIKKKKDTVLKVVDTSRFVFKDSIDLSNAELEKPGVKILVQQAPGSVDYFKYIFPFVTLIMGIGINKLFDYINERKRLKKIGERWAAEIRYMEKPISNQIQAMEGFLEEHKQEKFIVPKMNIYSGLDCEIFKSLDKSDLLKFLEKSKGNGYHNAVLSSNKIHGYVSILTSHYESLKAKFDEYLKETSTRTSQLTQNLQSLLKAFGTYQVLLEKELKGNDPVNDARYRPILDLINSQIMPYMANGDFDIYKLESDFLIPLIFILGELRHDDRTNELSEYAANCLNVIKGLKMEKKYLTENFETIIGYYREELGELDNVAKEVE